MSHFAKGQPLARSEDQRFITGNGRYTDDIVLPDQAWLQFLRSPYAHGRINELDISAAQAMPGVLAVYTGEDLVAGGVRDIPGAGMPDGSRAALQQPPLARDIVRYVGEPVAAVIAESAEAARAAADAILFDVEDLPAVVSPRQALASSAVLVHSSLDDNHFGTLTYGDKSATDAAFRSASHTVGIELVNNRVAPTALETRGCNVSYESASGNVTVYQGCQGVHPLRDRILKCIDIDADKLRVVSPDVGGGFGLKFFLQCETIVAVFASRALERPVKWTADRSESFMSDIHGRDHYSRAELALDSGGRFLAIRANVDANIGAYCSQAGPLIPWFGACMTAGCYDIATAYVEVRSVLTNTVPVDAYRGAGRPEATYLIERLVDKAALELRIPREQLRELNFIKPQQFPYTTATGRSYDSGEYAAVMQSALQRAAWGDFSRRREDSERRGKLRGIGLAYYVEICSAMGAEETHIGITENGRVEARVGTQSTGQGHETSYAQIVAGYLGIPPALVDVVQGDTQSVPTGQGTNGSRSMAIGGSSLALAAAEVLKAGKRMAGAMLQTEAAHIEYVDGQFYNKGSGKNLSLLDVAAASFDPGRRPDNVRPGLRCSARFEPDGGTFPNGCHVCEVEVDPATGTIEITRYTIEDDVGVVINPLLLEGQIVGGVAQGLGQALTEHAVYDADGGQLLTATLLDYGLPRADWVPAVDFRYREVPSPRNPLGVKGAGEAGTVGAAPALVNAVLDAVRVAGVQHLDMPLTPMTIWRALQDAAGSRH